MLTNRPTSRWGGNFTVSKLKRGSFFNYGYHKPKYACDWTSLQQDTGEHRQKKYWIQTEWIVNKIQMVSIFMACLQQILTQPWSWGMHEIKNRIKLLNYQGASPHLDHCFVPSAETAAPLIESTLHITRWELTTWLWWRSSHQTWYLPSKPPLLPAHHYSCLQYCRNHFNLYHYKANITDQD